MKIASFVKSWILAFICILSAIVSSCSEKTHETPTQGSLVMMTAEDIYPVIDLQVQTFTRIYEKAKITDLQTSTRDAVVQMLNDSVKLIVIPRELNAEEKKIVQKNSLDISSIKIAYDGVAVIVNERNGVKNITVQMLHDIVSGKVTSWSSVPGSHLSSATVVGIQNQNSGVYEFVHQRIIPGDSFTNQVNICASIPDVISTVSEHPNAIGFIPISWLKDQPNTIAVLAVGDPAFKRDSTSTTMEYFTPEQAYIYQTYYPLSRPVYLYTHNSGGGVALGFASFAAGAEGQKIIVKNGLVPATMPVRLVHLNNQ